MIRFTPSARWDANGNAIPGCDSHCYCEGECPMGTIQGFTGPAREEIDVEEDEVVVDTSVSNTDTSTGDLVHVFADAVTGDLLTGVRATLFREFSFGNRRVDLYFDGVLIDTSPEFAFTPGRFFLCVKEGGAVSATVVNAADPTEYVVVSADVTLGGRGVLGVEAEVPWNIGLTNWYHIETTEKTQCPPCPLVGCPECPEFPDVLESMIMGLTNDTGNQCPGCASQNGVWRSMLNDVVAGCGGIIGGALSECVWSEFSYQDCNNPTSPGGSPWPDNRCTEVGPCTGINLNNAEPIFAPSITVSDSPGTNTTLYSYTLSWIDCFDGAFNGIVFRAQQRVGPSCDLTNLNPLITGDENTGWNVTFSAGAAAGCNFNNITEIHLREPAGMSAGAMYDPCPPTEYRRGKPVIQKGRKKG